jgi:hypothetical protein
VYIVILNSPAYSNRTVHDPHKLDSTLTNPPSPWSQIQCAIARCNIHNLEKNHSSPFVTVLNIRNWTWLVVRNLGGSFVNKHETSNEHPSSRVVTATDRRTRPSITSNKALVRPLRKYSSIFEHILENFQRICQLHPISNGQNRPSIRLSRPYMTGLLPRPSYMTTLPSPWTRPIWCGASQSWPFVGS